MDSNLKNNSRQPKRELLRSPCVWSGSRAACACRASPAAVAGPPSWSCPSPSCRSTRSSRPSWSCCTSSSSRTCSSTSRCRSGSSCAVSIPSWPRAGGGGAGGSAAAADCLWRRLLFEATQSERTQFL